MNDNIEKELKIAIEIGDYESAIKLNDIIYNSCFREYKNLLNEARNLFNMQLELKPGIFNNKITNLVRKIELKKELLEKIVDFGISLIDDKLNQEGK